jgi:membrane fusion protein, heavy metal efflux system
MSERVDARAVPESRKLSHRTQLLILAAVAASMVIAWGAISLWHHFLQGKLSKSEASAGPPGTFKPSAEQWKNLPTEAARATTFRNEVVTDGNIAINEDAATPVFSPYSGRVSRLMAKPGDLVKQGAPLMAVEATEYVQGQNDLLTATAALETARAQLSQAQANENRQHELYLAKAGALKDWLQSKTDLATAVAAVRGAEVALQAAQGRLRILGRSDAEIAALEKTRQESRGNPEAIVAAPISGTVTQRQVGLGQYITSASTGASSPVFTIGNLSTVWLMANVRETDAPLMRVGDPIEVHILAFPDRSFKARLVWIAPSVDSVTHRVPVRAEVENRDGKLKPMMFASFSIFTGNPSKGVGIPASAVIYEGDEARVFVAREDGTIVAREIRTGRSDGAAIEVMAGIAPGERVVTGGALFIDRALSAE